MRDWNRRTKRGVTGWALEVTPLRGGALGDFEERVEKGEAFGGLEQRARDWERFMHRGVKKLGKTDSRGTACLAQMGLKKSVYNYERLRSVQTSMRNKESPEVHGERLYQQKSAAERGLKGSWGDNATE